MNYISITNSSTGNDYLVNLDAVAAFKTSPNAGKVRVYMRNGQKDLTAIQDFELEANYSDIVSALRTATVEVAGTHV